MAEIVTPGAGLGGGPKGIYQGTGPNCCCRLSGRQLLRLAYGFAFILDALGITKRKSKSLRASNVG